MATTNANAVVAPTHSQAVPVILTNSAEVDQRLNAETPIALKLQRPLPDEALGIVAKVEKRGRPWGRCWPEAFHGGAPAAGGWCFPVDQRLRSGMDEAHVSFRGVLGLGMGAKRVADMNDGHVDEIQQRPVRAGFPEGASLFQFLGDFDQTIDLSHRVVLLSWVLHPPSLRGREFPALRPEARLCFVNRQAPDYGPRIPINHYKLRSQLYTTGTNRAAVLFAGCKSRLASETKN